MPQPKLNYVAASEGPRFFVAPRNDIFDDFEPTQTLNQEPTKQQQQKEKKKKMRYAAYIRISSEDQVGNFSMDAQERGIQTWVTGQGGLLVNIYRDEAKSARTADRPAFQQMRKDARQGKFDALVVHKFDRFARNRTDALAIKSLLRYDYGVKVFSVTEPSEDSDGPMGALIEGIMESVADWYSKNLATEVAKGKKERTQQGFHNNIAPFGYRKDEDKVLVPDEFEAEGLRLAFEMYATDQYSDMEIATMLNERGYKTKRGRRFSKDTARDFLQNRTYTGMVRYQKTERHSDGSRCKTGTIEWFDGQHEALISDELFDKCQEVRRKRASHRQATTKYNPFLLRDIVYCYRCCTNHPDHEVVPSYGKMRGQSHTGNSYLYYRCRAKELGYTCDQGGVSVDDLDEQVLAILTSLKPPKQWRENITRSIGELLGEQDLEARLTEIRTVIERMDTRWDHGFITDEQKFLEQRIKLQQELEQLTPVDSNDLERAVDLLTNFSTHWAACGDNIDAQSEFIKQIVERVYVQDKKVVAMTLRSNCHLVLGHKMNEPTEYTVDPFITGINSDPALYASGDDGI
ncbi:MAG: recombinase family protein [Caldilineaceae bacterium]|nr:recombinase family protein [Caldilineaceae bacterium]